MGSQRKPKPNGYFGGWVFRSRIVYVRGCTMDIEGQCSTVPEAELPLPVPSKPWLDEPDYLKWIDRATGYRCIVRRSDHTGSLVGYVRIPRGHPFYRKHYRGRVERTISVHGGVTFSGRPLRYTGGYLRGHWFGFDCAHANDYMPAIAEQFGWVLDLGVYRDFEYVKQQVVSMAAQLKRKEKS